MTSLLFLLGTKGMLLMCLIQLWDCSLLYLLLLLNSHCNCSISVPTIGSLISQKLLNIKQRRHDVVFFSVWNKRYVVDVSNTIMWSLPALPATTNQLTLQLFHFCSDYWIAHFAEIVKHKTTQEYCDTHNRVVGWRKYFRWREFLMARIYDIYVYINI